jgi:hypothetical protein
MELSVLPGDLLVELAGQANRLRLPLHPLATLQAPEDREDDDGGRR